MADFTAVTETTNVRITREALAMVYTRYAFASRFCRDKSVLEVGCGVGQGLGYLARVAKRVVGGDLSPGLLHAAHRHYQGRIALAQFDAHELPFRDQSFDVVVLYEAIYYLRAPARFVAEGRRILREGGVVLVCTVNPEWRDFNPSPMSTNYFTAQQLRSLLEQHGLRADLYGAFAVDNGSPRAWAVSGLKRAAIRFHLVPKTMKGKQLLKRVFLGPLSFAPAEVADGMAPYLEPVLISGADQSHQYKVLLGVGHYI